ncbi:MAG: nuclease-related domain protein, partial [Anaerocolumna sp.]|nr:nuclease-related domain protein [Anaerocolumna sp.]
PKSNTIFVIETKNWGGVITGKNYDNNWKQELDGEEHWFYNTIKQNNAHCNALSRKYPNYNIKSLIVFVNRNSIVNNKSPEVIKLNRLIDYIKNKNI